MEIVTCKNILLEYFDLLVPRQKNEIEKSLQATIENDNNKFKISSEYLNILEKFFEKKGTQYLDFFRTFITNSVTENRVVSFKTETVSKNEEEIIQKCFEHNLSDYSFILTKSKSVFLQKNLPHNLCVLDNIIKPNQDWLIINILSGNTVDLDYSNFQSHKSISEFISFIPKMSKKTEKIQIIDSYFNVGTHNLIYTNLKISKPKIVCYSRIMNGENKNLKRKLIKDYFGKRKTSVLFSTDTKITHERKISIGNLIIEFTHDFAEIKPQNKNWTIYLKICDIKNKLFQENTSKYNAT